MGIFKVIFIVKQNKFEAQTEKEKLNPVLCRER